MAEAEGIEVRVEAPTEALGPVKAGARLGRLVWSKGGKDFYSVDWVAAAEARPADWWVAAWEHVVLFFRGLTGHPGPRALAP